MVSLNNNPGHNNVVADADDKSLEPSQAHSQIAFTNNEEPDLLFESLTVNNQTDAATSKAQQSSVLSHPQQPKACYFAQPNHSVDEQIQSFCLSE